jgi:hypothetical protein
MPVPIDIESVAFPIAEAIYLIFLVWHNYSAFSFDDLADDDRGTAACVATTKAF